MTWSPKPEATLETKEVTGETKLSWVSLLMACAGQRRVEGPGGQVFEIALSREGLGGPTPKGGTGRYGGSQWDFGVLLQAERYGSGVLSAIEAASEEGLRSPLEKADMTGWGRVSEHRPGGRYTCSAGRPPGGRFRRAEESPRSLQRSEAQGRTRP